MTERGEFEKYFNNPRRRATRQPVHIEDAYEIWQEARRVPEDSGETGEPAAHPADLGTAHYYTVAELAEFDGAGRGAGSREVNARIPFPASAELMEQFGSGRPLSRPLDDYWRGPCEDDSPLSYEWKDKPHRLVYDLIAAVLYYSQCNRAANNATA
ncbi:hypothetical protein F6X40_34540 [Paraburkholderia sp. UCT31]|uniref:hypothetical protein n=1 Tax=Paraburkholderia sp. UCT31 TaxID=2615209 RepID=UPI001654F595|nr:hypothetical protein [Paraburkholderia sp. UCT31]MBC8741682.1 hypothetical protein [Paraburkholderia sp. UCT31]